jgi:class 3 adenylate cyclase
MQGEAAVSETKSAEAWLEEVRGRERNGEFLLAYDTAMRALETHKDDVWLKHRAVLQLAKSGATRRARLEFDRLGLADRREGDIEALGARIAKDEALAEREPMRRRDLLHQAAELYEATWKRDGTYYHGVNAATLRLFGEELDLARKIAAKVLPRCVDPTEPYYAAASRAEAALVMGDEALAGDALREAARYGSDLAAQATTRRQLRLICHALGLSERVLEAIAPPGVVHYTGHRIGSRFPAQREDEVARAIAASLDRNRVAFGFGSLASGGDILVAEALLARGAELNVVLPFAAGEFKSISVTDADVGWAERFDACIARARTVTYATDDAYLGHDRLFAYASYVAMGLAVLRARNIDAAPRQLAIWDGHESDGPAGTGADVALWRAQGRELDIVECGHGSPPPAARRPAGGERELRAMLFGDVKGFSKLTEAQLPAFVTIVLGAMGDVVDRFGDVVLYRNTWGDGIFLVFADPVAAADCALELQRTMGSLALAGAGLPNTLALRLGGHFGPVFTATDPVQKVANFFGAHVSRTARIEPITPPGEVFVTEAFAARLALERDAFACDYVGVVPAAKDYGVLRMYHLRRGSAR